MAWRDARVVFQDIDGCLDLVGNPLPDGAGQSPSREQAQLLREIGRAVDASSVSEVVLNTGRGLAAMDFIVAELASRKVRYLLAEHGAIAFDLVTETTVDLNAIARRSGPPERAARYAQLEPIRAAIDWYNAHGEDQLSAHFELSLPALPKSANLTLMIPQGLAPKAVLSALESALQSHDGFDSNEFVYHSSDIYVDVLGTVDKGDGALLLLEELGRDPSEALAMGDGTNDIAMFEVLGSGYCPANAASELKQVCKSRDGVISSRHHGEAALELYRALA